MSQYPESSPQEKSGMSGLEKILILAAAILAGLVIFVLAILLFSQAFKPQSNQIGIMQTTPTRRSLPPTWTPTKFVFPPTSTVAPTPTSIPIPPTETAFHGYTAVEMNSQNYPAVDAVTFYSHPENYFKQRLQLGGTVIAFGYITVDGQDEFAIQVGPDLHEPAGQIVARAPVLVMNFDPNQDLRINQRIIVYGSGGGTITGTNTLGGEQESPIIFGEWYQLFSLKPGSVVIPPGCYNCP